MLNVLAVSAPHWQFKRVEQERHLNSSSPFSLQNALRVAADAALHGIGPWGQSNWSTAEGLRQCVFMSDYLDETLAWLDTALLRVRPNLLMIGAMSISYPGAIRIASRAKALLGDEVIVVIGGKHVIETTYAVDGRLLLHDASPIAAMHSQAIDRVFDLVVSGDGEDIIHEIGCAIAGNAALGLSVQSIVDYLADRTSIRGDWLVAWLGEQGPQFLQGSKLPIDYDNLPVPAALFAPTSAFAIFGTDLTAHAYSDTSKGCIYSCDFCSESQAINGKLRGIATAHERLFRQLKAVKGITANSQGTTSISAFVEDSILLQGNASSLAKLADLLEAEGLQLPFGGQLTIDMVNDGNRQAVIRRLARSGLRYIFMGLETPDEQLAASMHKNRVAAKKPQDDNLICQDAGHSSWMHRSETALRFFASEQIDCGLSLLFGLGEQHSQRVALLEKIAHWQQTIGQPRCISMNWAVKHPLRRLDNAPDHYRDWAIDAADPRAQLIARTFGEASTRYCMDGISMASLEQLSELNELYTRLNNVV